MTLTRVGELQDKPKKVGVVVLTYNEVALTLETLSALDQTLLSPSFEVTVVLVDNGSRAELTEELLKNIQQRGCSALFLHSPHNLGFGGGMNFGVRFLASGSAWDYYWFLNNDAAPSPESLGKLVSFAKANPGALLIGSTILDPRSGRIQCAGGCRYNSWLGKDFPQMSGELHSSFGTETPAKEAFDYVHGSALFVNAEFFHSVQGFDQRYFLYFEELSLAARCGKQGIAWCPQSIVYHHGGGTSRSSPALAAFCAYHAALSSFRYTAKHSFYKLPTVMMARLGGKWLHALVRREPLLILAVFSAVLDFITGRTRKDPKYFKFFGEAE